MTPYSESSNYFIPTCLVSMEIEGISAATTASLMMVSKVNVQLLAAIQYSNHQSKASLLRDMIATWYGKGHVLCLYARGVPCCDHTCPSGEARAS